MIVRDIEKALQHSNCNHWRYDSLSLSKQALVHACRHINKENEECQVLQLGGGDSALFWKSLGELELLHVQATIVEHHPIRAKEIKENLGDVPHSVDVMVVDGPMATAALLPIHYLLTPSNQMRLFS
ncbi:hypothetical protein [Brevibacillus formosus]|uniref:hypothetical protein n=1 Tax=Brevibacillus formosus TaxID=54913 RepID=UPI002155E472|nr:hypothetical protein [Brevibacillus formosus]